MLPRKQPLWKQPFEKGSVANRLEKVWGQRPNRGHDHHVPKIEQELDRPEQSGNFALTSASARPHTRQPADSCQLWSGFWFLGSFVLSLGDASDASYRDTKRTYNYSLLCKRNCWLLQWEIHWNSALGKRFDDTTVMAETEEELDEDERGEWKNSRLKAQHSQK